jgi:hypothetical protein
MAAGSRKKFALDLNDIIAFPDAAHMPVFPPAEKESWILLMEVRKLTARSRRQLLLPYK